MSDNIVSTPTHQRCVTSYAARTQYKPGEVHPPFIKVKDAIDIHCHAYEGQQNPFYLAKRASQAEMKGLLFKCIPGDDPGKAVREVQEETNRWADQQGIAPIQCWAGYVCGRQMTPVSPQGVREMIDAGEPLFPDSVEAMRLIRGYYGGFWFNSGRALYRLHAQSGASRGNEA